jgi:hypothetical protein
MPLSMIVTVSMVPSWSREIGHFAALAMSGGVGNRLAHHLSQFVG